MDTLKIEENKYIVNERIYYFHDIHNEETLEAWDRYALSCSSDSLKINEIFLTIIKEYIAFEKFVEKFDIDFIEFKNPDRKILAIALDFAKKHNIKTTYNSKFFITKNIVRGNVDFKNTAQDLKNKLLKISYQGKNLGIMENLALIRTPATNSKFRFIKDDPEINVLYENLTSFNDKSLINEESIYKYFKSSEKMIWLIKSLFKTNKEMKKNTNLLKSEIGKFTASEVYKTNKKHILRSFVFKYALEKLLKKTQCKTYYTGNCLDSFALIEEQVTKKYNIKLICVPHGLEGPITPHCYIGDIYYTSSELVAEKLNDVYGTNKFVFDGDICSKMYSYNREAITSEYKIVFFSAPVNIDINLYIIEQLTTCLKDNNIKLHLKIHPRDRVENYEKFKNDIIFLDSIEEALTGSICIAKGSAILVEALYNNSLSVNIMLGEYDRVFSKSIISLNNEKIINFDNTESLNKWILNYYKLK